MVWHVRSDPCGLITANMTIGLLIYAEVVVCYTLLYNWVGFDVNVVLYTIITILAMWSHSRCQYSEPGVVPLTPPPNSTNSSPGLSGAGTEPLMSVHVDSAATALPPIPMNHTAPVLNLTAATTAGGGGQETALPNAVPPPPPSSVSVAIASGLPPAAASSAIVASNATAHAAGKICKSCRVPKPYRAHHCSLCRRCVVKMDHHCPWVNNCVAFMNQKYFLLFLAYTFLCCLYSALLLVVRFITCSKDHDSCTVTGGDIALCIGVFIEALLFGLFTATMFGDQLFAIFDNTPGIDAMQRRRTGHRKGRMESLKDVWGETAFSWRWFLPLPPTQKLLADFHFELTRFDEPAALASDHTNELKHR